MSARKHDWPESIHGAHGRIDAYRAALTEASYSLAEAIPYIGGVKDDPTNAPWRRETAEGVYDRLKAARERCEAELAVWTESRA